MKEKKIAYSTVLSRQAVAQIRRESRARNIEQSRLVESAIEEFLDPSPKEERFSVFERRLNRIDSRTREVERELRALSEMFSLFIEVWFSNTEEVPDGEKSKAAERGRKRFEKFLNVLGERVSEVFPKLFSELKTEIEAEFEDSTPGFRSSL